MASIILVLAVKGRADEVQRLVVHGAKHIDNETIFQALQIYGEMDEDEIVTAFIAWLALTEDLSEAIEKCKEYYKLGLGTPPEAEDNLGRANENLEAMVRAALPASERLGMTDP